MLTLNLYQWDGRGQLHDIIMIDAMVAINYGRKNVKPDIENFYMRNCGSYFMDSGLVLLKYVKEQSSLVKFTSDIFIVIITKFRLNTRE